MARVLALASYDSFSRVVRLVGDLFSKQGAEVCYGLVQGEKQVISDVQRVELGAENTQTASIAEYVEKLRHDKYDVVLLALPGGPIREFTLRLSDFGSDRPYVAALYPGLVLRYPDHGFAARLGCDVVLVNCLDDLERCNRLSLAFGESPKARMFGVLALLQSVDRSQAKTDNGPILFLEQTVIPHSTAEREYLAQCLVNLAQRLPHRQIIVKPRTRPDDPSLHKTLAHIVPLLENARNGLSVPNLQISFDPVSTLYEQAEWALTLSSTTVAEALHYGLKAAILTDFGAHDDYGLGYFLESGLLTSFDEFDPDKPLPVNGEWAARYLANPHDYAEDVIRQILIEAKQPLPPMGLSRAVRSAKQNEFLLKGWGLGRLASENFSKKLSEPPKPRKPFLNRLLIRFLRYLLSKL